MFSVAGMSLLLGSVGPELRGRASAIYQGGFLIGGVAGPAAGGLVSAISLRAPFFVYAGTLALAAAIALGLPRWGVSDAGPTVTQPRRLADVARDRRFQAACIANACQGWNSHGVRSALVPLFVASTMYSDPQVAARWTGVAMAVSAGVQALAIYPAGAAVDRFGRRGPMLIGAGFAALGIAAIPFARNIAALGVALAFYALSSALSGTAPAALVADAAGPQRDRAVAVFSMSSDIGAIVGPLVAGLLADRVSFTAAFAVGAVAWVGSLVLSSRIPRRAPEYP
jgi:MFS family permease